MIGEKELKMMKRSPLLINTARGGLVQEAALIRAFEERWIAGAGLTYWSRSPPSNAPRPAASKLHLTPHFAWASGGAMQFLADQLIDKIDLWQKRTPQHLVT